MKLPIPISVSVGALMLSACLSSLGQDPFVKPGKTAAEPPAETGDGALRNVTIVTEIFQLGLAEVARIAALGDGNAKRAAVGTLVEEGKATLFDTNVVTTVSGQRAKVESIKELIYPAEWDPGEAAKLPKEGGLNNPSLNAAPMIVDGIAYWPPSSHPHPTVFETRPVGFTTEVDPQLDASGGRWHLAMAPELVVHVGTMDVMKVPHANEILSPTPMQRFATFRSHNSSLRGTGADYVLIGSAKPAPEIGNGQPLMMFARMLESKLLPPAIEPKSGQREAMVELIEIEASWLAANFEVDPGVFREAVEAEVQNGKASVVEVVLLAVPLGGIGQIDGVDEVVYATEFDPGKVPQFQVESKSEQSRFWPASAYPNGTGFETRNTGTSLKLSLGGGSSADVTIEQVAYLGKSVGNELITPRGKEPLCTMPVFATTRVTTIVHCAFGKPTFLGASSAWKGENEPNRERKLAFFLTLR